MIVSPVDHLRRSPEVTRDESDRKAVGLKLKGCSRRFSKRLGTRLHPADGLKEVASPLVRNFVHVNGSKWSFGELELSEGSLCTGGVQCTTHVNPPWYGKEL